jgi:hypothetical protein
MKTPFLIALGLVVAACAPTLHTEKDRSAYAAFWKCQNQEVAVDIHFVKVDAAGKLVYRGPDDDPHLKQVGDCLTKAGYEVVAIAEHEVEVEGPGSK